jgi:hypothetical protein
MVLNQTLPYSLIAILKIKWQHLILATLDTAVSAFLSSSPLIPMVVAIAQYAGYSRCNRHTENTCLCFAGGCNGDDFRINLWNILLKT